MRFRGCAADLLVAVDFERSENEISFGGLENYLRMVSLNSFPFFTPVFPFHGPKLQEFAVIFHLASIHASFLENIVISLEDEREGRCKRPSPFDNSFNEFYVIGS